MRWIALTAAAALVAGAAACELERTPQQRTEADEVATAERRYDRAAYDTVYWASEEASVNRGRDIYAWVCADCHGETGRGDGGRVIDGDTVRPPSFLRADWPYADQPEELQHKVFVGNELGMPHWGLRQMRPRDIVAVEQYIRLSLIQQER